MNVDDFKNAVNHGNDNKQPLSKKERLLKEIEQRKAQLKDLEQREKAQARKDDTRRKIIAGALALEHGVIDNEFRDTLNRLLNEHVKTKRDRALFGLAPLE